MQADQERKVFLGFQTSKSSKHSNGQFCWAPKPNVSLTYKVSTDDLNPTKSKDIMSSYDTNSIKSMKNFQNAGE